MTPEQIARAKELDAQARTGPWQWYGNTKMNEVYLSTVDRGRTFVMDFARWGMTGAQPRFQIALAGGGIMRTLGELAKEESPLGPRFEVEYRRQFVGIGHPDAQFVAEARVLLPAAVAEIERLRGLLAGASR